MQITYLVQQTIYLGYYLKEQKKSHGILLKKDRKRDPGLIQLYQIIILLNCFGKIVERVVAQQLALYCETYSKLHSGQMNTQKNRSAINDVSILVHRVQKSWEEKKLAEALFMDVKGAFDNVLRSQLFRNMIELSINGNLVAQTRFFLIDRKIQIIIDEYENKERKIEMDIS